jgi:MEMO1 family protein
MTTHARVRPPALVGSFYEADPLALMASVDALLAQGLALLTAQLPAQTQCPKILVLPHAGHVYSGLAASLGYARIVSFIAAHSAPNSANIRRIVMLCPAHREYFTGVALPAVSAFATPLGTMQVDALGVAAVADLPFVGAYAAAHAHEHALEVHLPFFQRLWKDAPPDQQPTILPMVVGDVPVEQVVQLIDRLWGNAETLIVISTDLSHFHTYDQARAIDGATCERVRALQTNITHTEACGATPLNAALALAQRKGLVLEQLAYCNSGDTAGNTPQGRERVVGYASFALYDSVPIESIGLQPQQGAILVQLARASLQANTGAAATAIPSQAPWLLALGACFVTLTQRGQLCGCIGSLQAHRSLWDDIVHNAAAAALQDHRFAPVTADVAPSLAIEVSVLTAPVPLSFANEAHALWQLQPLQRSVEGSVEGVTGCGAGCGVGDGVIFSAEVDGQSYRSTFLPQVWAQMADVQQFMAQLKLKAGLAADFWSDSVQLQTYRVQEFHEDLETTKGRTVGEAHP